MIKIENSEVYQELKIKRDQLLGELMEVAHEMENMKGYDHLSVTSQIINKLQSLKGETENDN